MKTLLPTIVLLSASCPSGIVRNGALERLVIGNKSGRHRDVKALPE